MELFYEKGSETMPIASGQITILDMTDNIIVGTAPVNPTEGSLWIDNSVVPNKIYVYKNKTWDEQTLSVEGLDPAYAEKANKAVQQNNLYNGIQITPESGLVALRSDNKVKAILNATDGIKILKSSDNGLSWDDVFYTDTDGVIHAKGLVISSDSKIGNTVASQVVSNAEDAKASVEQLRGLTNVRYIREYQNGNTVDSENHIVEVQAMNADGVNVALHKMVTSSAANATNLTSVTDGITTSDDYASFGTGAQWIQVDLGAIYNNIDYVQIWNHYADARTFHEVKLEVSEDGTNWTTVFDSTVDGEYQESAEGKVIPINANVPADLRNIGEHINVLSSSIGNIEESITPEGISTLISDSVFYENYTAELEGKADADAIGNLATKDEVSDLSKDVDGRITNAIDEIDFEPYATKLELEETSKSITTKFSATGGMNLIKNSIGFADFDFWEGTNLEQIQPVANGGLDVLGFGSGFHFPPSDVNRILAQDIFAVEGEIYTISWYVKKTNTSDSSNTDGAFLIEIIDSNDAVVASYQYDSEMVTNDYEPNHFSFYAPESDLSIRITAHALADATITGLMLTIGSIPLQWSLATGETYNTNVRLDIHGVRVSQLDEEKNEVGYTQITPEEFAGFYRENVDNDFEKVFYLNGEETVTKKFQAKNEITMGNIKIVNINSGGKNGWAFIPNFLN